MSADELYQTRDIIPGMIEHHDLWASELADMDSEAVAFHRDAAKFLRQLAERADHVPDVGNKVSAPEVSPPFDICPKCGAELPSGTDCGLGLCGLKRCFHPDCGTPTQPSACDFAQCPRKW